MFGAEIADRHGGPAPVGVLIAGAIVMAGMLAAQGVLGLIPPVGENATLSGLAVSYFGPKSRIVLNVLLALAMVGWFGFNVGLGGAAAAALLDVPAPVGPLLLAAPILLFSFGGIGRWNLFAVVTTCSALILVAVVAVRLAEPVSPMTLGGGGATIVVADLAAFIGFVAVFSLRAPDFSIGLATRRDLTWCVALLVGPAILIMLAGIGLRLGTGSADLVGTLAGADGLPVANLLVAVAVIAPAFTTTYSGSLAIRGFSSLGDRTAMLAVLVPGLALAAARFDQHLFSWLTVLAALLPPVMVPMAVEGTRRRKGHPPRRVPLWVFGPACLCATVLTIGGLAPAPLLGMAVAAASTGAWVLGERARSR